MYYYFFDMLPLLDTHQHLVYREQTSCGLTKDIPLTAKDNFTLENYKSLTDNLGIGGTLFMSTGVDNDDYQKESSNSK